MLLNCFKCNKKLKNFCDDTEIIQPIDGIAFRTYGHYGTTYFDPMDGSYIDIVICDECMQTGEGKLIICYK